MKRSSSIAALDDSIDINMNKPSVYCEGENVLVTSMMLVTIDENRREKQLLRKQRSNGSMSSISGVSSLSGVSMSSLSRSSSRGSLRGWGSSASRKSYKVDLCSLACVNDVFHGDLAVALPTKTRRKFPKALALQKGRASNGKGGSSSGTNDALDSWGFFLE
jgi:hypothetical protein